ncbi:hypothetical protein LSH36_1g07040 [Paralvinella palmiformis]|uniref:Uncharacterized protein n=1 Tax=Paralvinella palmiformis TaxID=53620 RepID=A0AAD9NJB8_9ANNE|nr:hypothetical protein LSH36_1g07040 [Paralvinella palmiformis]
MSGQQTSTRIASGRWRGGGGVGVGSASSSGTAPFSSPADTLSSKNRVDGRTTTGHVYKKRTRRHRIAIVIPFCCRLADHRNNFHSTSMVDFIRPENVACRYPEVAE